jgi:16S rRNA (cytidine1402-2'-O)-methyltransferase
VGTLHLVPVPIADPAQGEGADPAGLLAPAAVAVARRVHYFLVENARSARAFLKSIGHPQAIASLQIVEIGHAPPAERLEEWLAPLADRPGAPGIDAVVLSEAGCPGVADPGATLVARAHERGIRVMPWVGPSAILLALMGSGLNGQQFRFLGYLPQERDALQERLRQVQRDALDGETQIFIETPYRNQRLFDALLQTCSPALRLCLAVDLTGPAQVLATRTIGEWRSLAPSALPVMDRRPAVFLLHGQPAAVPAPAKRRNGPSGARRG